MLSSISKLVQID